METKLLTVDVSVLDSLREIEPALVGQVISIFLDSAPADIAKIAHAVEQKCAPDLSAMAHGLKSASASVGAMAVSHYCLELEKMGRSGVVAPGECDKLLKCLQDSFQSALSELQKYK
jgi:HPt (histidine-containing phosphotransfer) domain-containing protein